jgi:fumarylacetoacetate (FAA) hydrolase
LNDSNFEEQWLKDGDMVEMNIDALGELKNTIVAEETDWSILSRKKNV